MALVKRKVLILKRYFHPWLKCLQSVVLGLAASLNLEIDQLDVKIAFLHGDLDEDIYMVQPEGFVVKCKENFVCKLRKSLYRFKQAPRQCNRKFDSFMMDHRYDKTSYDHYVFVKKFPNEKYIILLLYVDDMLIADHDKNDIQSHKRVLKNGKLWLS